MVVYKIIHKPKELGHHYPSDSITFVNVAAASIKVYPQNIHKQSSLEYGFA
ncbi:MAG: hypothetical protein QXQ70_01380 [Candidatus Caldarchaeum sp.]